MSDADIEAPEEGSEIPESPTAASPEIPEAQAGAGEVLAEAPADPTAEAVPEGSESLDLAAALEAAESEALEWKTRAQWAHADVANLRKRATKEHQDARKFAVEALLKDLLSVSDNLERALAHADADDPLAQGVEMVLQQFRVILEQHGAKPFVALGELFDPAHHEAMTQLETADSEPGTVIQVFQRGWMLNGRLARPAMVMIAKSPERIDEADNTPVEEASATSETPMELAVEAEVPAPDSQEAELEEGAVDATSEEERGCS